MRVFAKKTFEFKVGDEKVRVRPYVFETVPDGVIKDPYFILVQKDGDIEILESVAAEKKVEKKVADEK